VHQFVRVGKMAIVGGLSKVVQDIPPFCTADGHPARVFGLNLIGLRRNNVPRQTIKELDAAFRVIFNSGMTRKKAIGQLSEKDLACPEVSYLVAFIKNSSRGVIRSCRSNGSSESED